jgi:hypothetical protein
MNLKETLLAHKKITHNSPLYKELFDAVAKYNIKNYNEAVYVYLNNLIEIPKCPFSTENQYFDRTHYVGYSKKYFRFIKHDVHLKCKWLSWGNLFYKGLTLEKAENLLCNKTLLKTRSSFPIDNFDNFNKENIFNIFINKGYLKNTIEKILILDFSTIEGVLEFVNLYNHLSSAKNNTIEYFLNRGYSNELSKEKVCEFHNTWKKFNNTIDKESERYKHWLESRKIGLSVVRKSLRSKFEKKIFNELQTVFNINLKYNTKVNNSAFSKCIFKHDFLINDCLIVEYNGSYWHNDILSDKRFTSLDLYKLEILRADISIKASKYKYLILWEYDIKKDIKLVQHFIEIALNGNELFYSSRDFDVNLYNELSK